jgi:hypothetical protein
MSLHVNCPILLPHFKEICNTWTDFYKIPANTKYRGNPSSEGRAVTYGQTDITKLVGANDRNLFRKYVVF